VQFGTAEQAALDLYWIGGVVVVEEMGVVEGASCAAPTALARSNR
jgi:hypothetical protein